MCASLLLYKYILLLQTHEAPLAPYTRAYNIKDWRYTLFFLFATTFLPLVQIFIRWRNFFFLAQLFFTGATFFFALIPYMELFTRFEIQRKTIEALARKIGSGTN